MIREKVNLCDLKRVLLKLDDEFCLSKTIPADDSCGYPHPFSSIANVFSLVPKRGVSQIDNFYWGVPNEAIQENLRRLSGCGRGFIGALYPVVDRFVELVKRCERRGYVAAD